MKQWTTTEDFIANGKIPSSAQVGFIVQTEGYSSKGDGGGAQWKFAGVTGQTPSKSPADLGEPSLIDASGNKFEYVPISATSVQEFNIRHLGAVGSGNHTASINAATMSDVVVVAPAGTYSVDGVINLGSASSTYGNSGSKLIGDGAGRTIIESSSLTGEVIRSSNWYCGCEGATITSNTDRESNGDDTCIGIRHEGNDQPSGHRFAKMGLYKNNVIEKQPSHGVVLVGNVVGTRLDNNFIENNGGHGLVISSGEATGRVNKGRCGIITINENEITNNIGNAIVAGYDSTSVNVSNSTYRLVLNNNDIFGNALTNAVRLSDSQALIIGENITLDSNAFGGWEGEPRTLATKGVTIAGAFIDILNTRFIDVLDNAIDIVSYTNLKPRSININQILHTGTVGNMLNPAVTSATETEGLTIKSYDSGNVTSLHSRSDRRSLEIKDERGTTKTDILVSPSFSSNFESFIINNDNVFELDFGDSAYGMLILGSNSQSRGFATVHFRVGSFGHCTLLSSSGNSFSGNSGANVVATTGTLNGTTGAVGNLTISANSDNKLYIENRTGDNGIYSRSFISMQYTSNPQSIG